MTVRDLIKTLLDFDLNATLDLVHFEIGKEGPVFEVRLKGFKQKQVLKQKALPTEEDFLND